jgi:hypothetical protein
MLAPVAAGGRVVMLQQFDTIKVWSHLLGIAAGLNAAQPLPRVNVYPALPDHYLKLMERYSQLFTEAKTRTFVKARCLQRMEAMISCGPGDSW